MEEAPTAMPATTGTLARFAVLRPGRPKITGLFAFTNKVHQALCALSDLGEGPAACFSGRSAHGAPLRQHEHAYLFCETAALDDTIARLHVWTAGTFDPQSTVALARLERIWGHGGPDAQLRLEGIGTTALGPASWFGSAQEWTSFTPFISSRHAKTHKDGRPKIDPDNGWPVASGPHELLRLLAMEPRFAGATVRLEQSAKPFSYGRSHHAPFRFGTTRDGKGGNKGEAVGSALTIRFPQPVAGPIALGFGAHFGLGMFRAVGPKPQPGGTMNEA